MTSNTSPTTEQTRDERCTSGRGLVAGGERRLRVARRQTPVQGGGRASKEATRRLGGEARVRLLAS